MQDAVLLEERTTPSGMKLVVATLNSPKTLNALTLDMIRILAAGFLRWASDPTVACVILNGAGDKGFCAGADVRSLRQAILANPALIPNPEALAFFSEEYRLDYHIHTYPKPVLVFGDGVVMGGGLGLMAGGSHRVVTQRSRIAMPEMTIGLFPDVGASWFLPRMPERAGLFLALTGAALNGHDALTVGLADYCINFADKDLLFEQLSGIEWGESALGNHAALSRTLRSFAGLAQGELPRSNVRSHVDTIKRLTQGSCLPEVQALMTDYRGHEPWLERAIGTFIKGSPTTAALIWDIWHRAKHYSLAEALRMELIVALQCCAHPDFPEGVRALLVDKDNSPRWTPPSADEVSPQWVCEHFVAPWPVTSMSPLSDLK